MTYPQPAGPPISIADFAFFKDANDKLAFSTGSFISKNVALAISSAWKEVYMASSSASMYLKEES